MILSNTASITLAEGEIANFDNLTLYLEDIDKLGETINLSNILSDNLSVVLAALEENDVVTIQFGSEIFSALVGENGIATITSVPEPSTYAMIFGAIALGFVAYRRRK